MRGHVKYVPGELYPYEATALIGRRLLFLAGNFSMNQIPEGDPFMRERTFAIERRIAPLGPAHTGREGTDAGIR